MTATTAQRPVATEPTSRTRRSPWKRTEARAAYLFLSPVLLFFTIFLILPFAFVVLLALSKWSGFDITDMDWIGLHNFTAILNPDGTFVKTVLANTLIFAFGSVLLTVVAAVSVAHCITRLRFPGFWRTLYFLPVVATVVAIGNVWKSLYDQGGLINGVLNKLGIDSVGFLTDPDYALPSVIVAQAWASIGGAVLITTAGLMAIPNDYYEAAEIDAANSWQMFWRITLPLLRPTLLFVLITQFIAGLQSFALIIIMTKDGGPVNATNVAAFEMYQRAFKFGAWGSAAAMALVLFVIIFAITLIQLWLFRARGEDA